MKTLGGRALAEHEPEHGRGGVSAIYDTSIVTSTLLTNEAKLTQVSSDWWAKSPVPTFDAAHFYLVTKITEPFGNRSAVTYDSYDLLPTETHTSETTAALDNVTAFDNDYRVLAPKMVTDPNENRTEILFDELGLIVKMAVLGKASSPEGDTLSDPTAYFEYDLANWMNNTLPVFAHGFAREQHGDEVMETTKTGLRQRITVPPELLEVLQWHVDTQLETDEQEASDLLFPREDGGFRSENCLKKIFRIVGGLIGLKKKFTPRGMRRTFNDMARAAKVESLVTKSISGHLTDRMKDHYSTVSPVEQRDSIGRVLRLVTDGGGAPSGAPTASSGAPEKERVA